MAQLEITTHIGCPMQCVDCPQPLLFSKYKGKRTLDFEDYKMVIDKLPQSIQIVFSGLCECFTNPRCADMILYAYEKGHSLMLYTTLQGATQEDYEKLKHVKYAVVTIHLPDCENRSTFRITDEYLNVLSKWECNNYSCHGKLDERVIPYMKRGKNFITYMHDRAGNLETGQHFYIPSNMNTVCAKTHTNLNENVLLPDGTVIMCCMDYGMTGVFGNLFTQSYDEIISSEAAQQMRENMKHNDCICKHCVYGRIQ